MIKKNYIIKGLTVITEYKGNKKNFTENSFDNNKIKLKYQGKSMTFDFWGSVINPVVETENDIYDALYSILYDYTVYDNTMCLEDYLNEFGFENNAKNRKMYEKLETNSLKLKKLFSNDLERVLQLIYKNINETDQPFLYNILLSFNLENNPEFIESTETEIIEKLCNKYNLYYQKFRTYKSDEYFEKNSIPVYFLLDDNRTEFLLRDF